MRNSDFAPFFNPKSIAVIGVSRGDFRFGATSFFVALQDCHFPGRLYPINPRAEEIRGLKAYPDLLSLPEVPDLVMVGVASELVPSILGECVRIGARNIHIFSSGFGEIGGQKEKRLEQEISSISREGGLMVVGPNCMGTYCPSSRLTAWGVAPGITGPLGIISQSGGIAQRLIEHICSLHIGVEKGVSFGNGAVLDSTEFLEFMAEDEGVSVIAMYLESVKEGRKLFRLVKEVNRRKPIILWKGGESEVGATTAASHTGAMSGEPALWEAFCRQSGVIKVGSMEEWVDAIVTMCLLPAPKGKGVFLIGGGGGSSVAHSDICVREGLSVPSLSISTMEVLRQSAPQAGSIAGNPLDMWRTFEDIDYLSQVLELANQDPNVAMLIVDRLIPRKAYHMQDTPDSTQAAIAFAKQGQQRKPTVFTVESDGGDPELAEKGAELRGQYCKAGFPAYPSLNRAAKALAHLYRYHARTRLLGRRPAQK